MSTEPQPRLTELLAEFVTGTSPTAYPDVAVAHAKRLLLDTIGVTLAASRFPVGRTITAFVRETGRAPSTASVIGGGFKAYAPAAAMANGTMANALDYDEGYHVATHVVPTALAVAERSGCSGRDVLDAVVVGFEAAARLTRAIDAKRKQQGGPTHRGWWHVGLVAPISAAMTTARLLDLDRRTTMMAMGIATCGSGGFRRNMGTMSKGLHSGRGARDGIEAVMLAQQGFTSDPEILEAPLGFMAAVVDASDRDIPAITERLGRPFVLEEAPRIKAIPACTPAHGMIDAAIAALARSARSADDIDSVEADLHPFSLNRPEARDADSAGFSGAYLVASALVHGDFRLAQVTDEATRDERVRALARRIRHVPAGRGKESILLRFTDGSEQRFETETHSRRLLTDSEVEGKFVDCANDAIDSRAIDVVLDQISTLQQRPSIDALMAAVRG